MWDTHIAFSREPYGKVLGQEIVTFAAVLRLQSQARDIVQDVISELPKMRVTDDDTPFGVMCTVIRRGNRIANELVLPATSL